MSPVNSTTLKLALNLRSIWATLSDGSEINCSNQINNIVMTFSLGFFNFNETDKLLIRNFTLWNEFSGSFNPSSKPLICLSFLLLILHIITMTSKKPWFQSKLRCAYPKGIDLQFVQKLNLPLIWIMNQALHLYLHCQLSFKKF